MKNPLLHSINLEDLKQEARRLDIKFPNGMEIKDIKTVEEMAFVQKMVIDYQISQVGKFDRLPSSQQEKTAKPLTKSYSEVAAKYLNEVSLKNVPKTIADKKSEFRRFTEIFGNLPIGDISVESAVSYKNRLISEKNTIRQINKRLSYNNELFRYAVTNGYLTATNPFLNLYVGDKKTVQENTEHYENFTIQELIRIFNPDIYSQFLNKPDYFYGPFLSLYSGARLEEICSLQVDQIKTESGIVYFDVKKAKNKNSIRKIPLHKNILKSSFMDFVAKQRSNKCTMLFDHLVKGKNGFGKNLGRRFGQYLDLPEINIQEKTKVFHSFRHTAINNLTEKNVNPALIMGLVGHYYQAKIDLSAVHFSTYQHNKNLSAMEEIVNKIDYGVEFKIDK